MPTTSLVLPFAVPAKDRGEAFTSNMEVAAVLLLAEVKRRKLGFFEVAKKIVFASKLHYPLWVVPWENGSLIIDGLDVFSAAITCQALPDITSFIDDIERGASDRKQFQVSLEKHKKTFIDFAENVEVKVDALISDRELLSAVFEYVRETTASMQSEENLSVVLTPPKLDVQAAVECAKQVSRLHKQIQSEISSLEYVRGLLKEISNLHEQMILKEIEFTREAYNEEISKLQPAIERKVDQLQRERDAEIAKMNRIVENELKAKESERERRERELQKLELQKADFIRRRDMRKRKYDKIGLARWEHRIKVCENRIREVKRRINDLTEFIEETRRQNEADIEKLRLSYQELMEKEKSRIANLEAQRDENIESKQNEIEALKLATGKIVNQIEELMNRKREGEKELKELAIPWQTEDVSLICLPFYLVGYQTGKKTQLQIFPPARVASSKGIIKAFKKTLLGFTPASKIKLFLQLRSKALARMLDFALEKREKSDKAFDEALCQAAASANILAGHNFRETLIKGLEELKAEGWIGQKEVDALAKAYV
jgi:hypothetical protein